MRTKDLRRQTLIGGDRQAWTLVTIWSMATTNRNETITMGAEDIMRAGHTASMNQNVWTLMIMEAGRSKVGIMTHTDQDIIMMNCQMVSVDCTADATCALGTYSI